MERDWNSFKELHGNIEGAREAFEDACFTLFKKVYPDKNVSKVKVNQGDSGIDIFIGEFGIEPITVIQCKFFLENFGDSQKSQIRQSFKTASTNREYVIKEWILCIPITLDIKGNKWWFEWKHKQLTEQAKDDSFIKLKCGDELIDLMKEFNLYKTIFKIEDSIKIDEIHKAICIPQKITAQKAVNDKVILFNNYTPQSEPYYVERTEDYEFIKSLDISNVWIHGDSGIGKTALIHRNLLIQNIKYFSCDFSPVKIIDSMVVLNELLFSIETTLGIKKSTLDNNIIRKIVHTLGKVGNQEVVIVIDEFSVTNDELLEEIMVDLNRVVVYFNNSNKQAKLKFVISTISNPNRILEDNLKAADYFQYICCNGWDGHIDRLFDLLNESLFLDLLDHKEDILSKSVNSPRTLKTILRKIHSLPIKNSQTINSAIKLALNEIVS